MKMCPNCRNQISDEAVYCPICGSAVGTVPQYQQQAPQINPAYNASYTQNPAPAASVPKVDPFDHTAEFEAADISENKVIAMLVYLLGLAGVVVALLAAATSKYVAFHVRQALKLTVLDVLTALALVIFVFLTAMVNLEGFGLFVAFFAVAVLLLIRIICFLQVCHGRATEAYVVRSLTFFK